jgi:hypothetical protein
LSNPFASTFRESLTLAHSPRLARYYLALRTLAYTSNYTALFPECQGVLPQLPPNLEEIPPFLAVHFLPVPSSLFGSLLLPISRPADFWRISQPLNHPREFGAVLIHHARVVRERGHAGDYRTRHARHSCWRARLL